ncbi:AAA family ATPase [Xanthomonas sp. fls2-241-TYG-148]|uniref:AAA family ATPase n=1 Tax=Xanthomonas sp. fls2-241-TYG-148 TaxID=3040328 RepID=UPI002556FCF1|nr:AAA family ATPase [Xanthomonas sp. fls2-241-TYG-148]
MIEELTFRAMQFWRSVDDAKVTSTQRHDDRYLRSCLLIYFIVAWDALPTKEERERREGLLDRLADKDVEEFKHRFHSLVRDFDIFAETPDLRGASELVSKELFDRIYIQMRDVSDQATHAVFFDYRLQQLIAAGKWNDPRHTRFSTVLSNALSLKSDLMVDAFCSSGELFSTGERERWRRHGVDYALIQNLGDFVAERRMRLAIYGWRGELRKFSIQPAYLTPRGSTFLHIDPPAGRTRRLSFPRHVEIIEEQVETSLEMLRLLLEERLRFGGMAVVSGAERVQPRKTVEGIRARLVETGQLVAVIDFPPVPGAKVRTARSAWVIDSRGESRPGGVLMVSLRSLGKIRDVREFGIAAEFAGRVVNAFVGGDQLSSRWATLDMGDAAEDLQLLFRREFSSGYRDVPGLCRVISRDELGRNGWKLDASLHVNSPQQPSFLSGIDGDPILEILIKKNPRARVVYVIGNNGEGKSLLLRELANSMNDRDRHVVGIAFGMSDRFPLVAGEEGFERFVYQGDRKSRSVARPQKLAADMCRRIIDIYCDPHRLSAFTEGLRLLQFGMNPFILPFGNGTLADDLAVTELTNDFEENRRIAKRYYNSQAQAAFVRRAPKGKITPFADLSSGEQQVVALMVKFIASAEKGGLILIDEPETSLHVSWQLLLPGLLRRLAEHFVCDVVVATHSPLLLSRTTSEDDCFSAERRRLTVIAPYELRSVERILFAAFGTYTTNNRLIHEKCASLVAAAMKVANLEGSNPRDLEPIVSELASIRRTIREFKDIDGQEEFNRDMELIDKTRAAIAQIRSWQEPNVPALEGDGK